MAIQAYNLSFDDDLSGVACRGCGKAEPLPPFDKPASHRWPVRLVLLPAPLWQPDGMVLWVEELTGLPPWDAAIVRFDEKHKGCPCG